MKYNLPNLKIVSLNRLVLHEVADGRRVLRLKKKILRDKIFTNPPVVAQMPGGNQYIVLDGANRVTAMQELKFFHLVIQVVDYISPEVRLDTWNHLVCNLDDKTGLLIYDIATKSKFAKIKRSKTILLRKIKKEKLKEQLRFINHIFDLYRNKNFHRVLGDNIKNFDQEFEKISFLIIYPKLTPAEIIAITKNHLKVPSGITRHIIQNRAIGIDVNLNLLKSNKTIGEKNKYLKQLISKRSKAHKIRYYKEPVTIFND